eukprot:COSAG05_NODE_894_length_6706_cov_13.114424_2_plen_54_part_00
MKSTGRLLLFVGFEGTGYESRVGRPCIIIQVHVLYDNTTLLVGLTAYNAVNSR